MSVRILPRCIARLILFGALAAISTSGRLGQVASAQGFYFESWHGGWGGPAGISIGIGVPPSGPLFYGVRPPQIFPPLGFPDVYRPPAAFVYRDYRADYYDRLHQQYSLQLDAANRYRVDPLHQSRINDYLRGLSVPPLGGVPPVVPIQPYSHPFGHGDATEMPQSHPVPGADPTVRLRDAAQRLTQALARRGEEGEIWLDYLGPETIVHVLDQGSDPRELADLLLHYEGVLANGDLRWLWRTDGFMDTRQWLRQYISSASANGGAEPQTSEGISGEDDTLEDDAPNFQRSPVPPPPPMPPHPSPVSAGPSSRAPAAAAAPAQGLQVPKTSTGVSL